MKKISIKFKAAFAAYFFIKTFSFIEKYVKIRSNKTGGARMKNNYKIMRTIFENTFQRVLECKDDKTGEIFYSNIIMNKKVINLINLESINTINSNIIECYCSSDRLYIFTNQLNTYSKSLREYIINTELSIKKQYDLTKKVIELTMNIFNMTDIVQKKILDLDKLYVDEKGNLIVDLNFIFEQEYDISDNETFYSLGNIIHFIFSKEEIDDYNISEAVPPDILKIIVRSITKEYMHPKDALAEMYNSPIYNMINSFSGKNNKNNKNENIKAEAKKIFENENIENYSKNEEKRENVNSLNLDDSKQINKKAIMEAAVGDLENEKIFNAEIQDKVIFDIYLNSEDEDDDEEYEGTSYFNSDIIKKAIISIVALVIILMAGKFLINKINESKEVASVLPVGNQSESNSDAQNKTELLDGESKYLNEELIKSSGFTGNVAAIDNETYAEGSNSLLIANSKNESNKTLFASIDFTDENNKYMQKKQIALSAKAKSEKDLVASVVLEAYKNGKLTTTFNKDVEIFDDMWSQIMVPVNMPEADMLNVYLQYEGKNNVWMDSLLIDITK